MQHAECCLDSPRLFKLIKEAHMNRRSNKFHCRIRDIRELSPEDTERESYTITPAAKKLLDEIKETMKTITDTYVRKDKNNGKD